MTSGRNYADIYETFLTLYSEVVLMLRQPYHVDKAGNPEQNEITRAWYFLDPNGTSLWYSVCGQRKPSVGE